MKAKRELSNSGKRIRQILEKNGKNQAWLAEQIGISENALTKIMRGQNGLTKSRAKEIASLFPGTRPEWLLCLVEDQTDEDRWNRIRKKMIEKDDLVEQLIELSGYTIHYQFLDEQTDADGKTTRNYSGVTITSRSGQKRSLPLGQYELIKQDIINYIKGKLLVIFTEDYFDSIEKILRMVKYDG